MKMLEVVLEVISDFGVEIALLCGIVLVFI